MPLNRIAWSITVLICAVATILLVVSGYWGYAGVLAVTGASAAINLR